MDQATHNKIVSFIWGIADDVLRDVFVRGKYRDVILPMCVLRRLDAVLEPTKKAVLETKEMLDRAAITEQRAALCASSCQAFYNTSKFTLRDLKSRAASSSSGRILKPTSTASHLTSRTSCSTSSFATASPGSPRPTPLARSSTNSSTRK
jgi:type I restriction-modification system DNA methylase subunit